MTTTITNTPDRQNCACGARPLLTVTDSAQGCCLSCTECGAVGPFAPSEAEATARWNAGERVSSDEQVRTAISMLKAYAASLLRLDNELLDELDKAIEAAWNAMTEHMDGDYETPLTSSW
jgi:hypothetical protein